MNDLKKSVIDSIEKTLHDMQTPSFRNGAHAVGLTAERLAAEGIYGMFMNDIVKPIDTVLTVPAAEYVPAIQDAFNIIDRAR